MDVLCFLYFILLASARGEDREGQVQVGTGFRVVERIELNELNGNPKGK